MARDGFCDGRKYIKLIGESPLVADFKADRSDWKLTNAGLSLAAIVQFAASQNIGLVTMQNRKAPSIDKELSEAQISNLR